MNKRSIIGVSILAVVLIVLGSQANVVGYQTVQSSVKERLNEKDLLFQTICDLSNNKEVQKTILESQGKFQNSFPSPQLASFPIITKKQLNIMYHLGIVLSRTIGKTHLTSLAKGQLTLTNQTKGKIQEIIKDNISLSKKIDYLSLYNCNCLGKTSDKFPYLCILFLIICVIPAGIVNELVYKLQLIGFIIGLPFWIISFVGFFLWCLFDCTFSPGVNLSGNIW